MNAAWPEFPVAKDDDDDDVAWALSTAQVQWKRGSQADAVVWLRRAVDSAVSVGATWRAAELTRETDQLEAFLLSGAGAAPAPATVSVPQQVVIDEFDGTEMIDSEAMSLPPDASLDDSLPPLTDTPESSPSAEEVEAAEEIEAESDVEAAEGFAVASEVDDDEVLEIDDEDIAEDELGNAEDEPRFPSEAPTANLALPPISAPPEPEQDPSPTPLRQSIAEIEVEPDSDHEAEPAPDTDRQSEPPLDTDRESALPLATERESEPPPDTDRESAPPLAMDRESEPPLATERESEPPLAMDRESEPPRARQPEHASEPLHELKSEPEPQPEPELPPPSVQTEPFVAGISLAEIAGFEDFPPETQLALAKQARVERLATEEEVSGFGLALVLRGAVNVMPAIADVACGSATERELVFGRGTLTEGVALRLVATAPDTQIALWDFDVIEPPLADCPWVLEELQSVADRYQALAGVAMGPMGERLDDSLRGMVLSRCKLVKLLPGELLVEKGKPVKGLFIVGAGRLELGTDAADGSLNPGDFLFAPQILGGGAAPTSARAGSAGALLMAADRHDAHELMLSVPPLLELLAG